MYDLSESYNFERNALILLYVTILGGAGAKYFTTCI